MIQRENYLSKIRPFYHSDLIKILTGVRRSGKSIILEQIMHEIKKIFFKYHLFRFRRSFHNFEFNKLARCSKLY